MSDIYGHYFTGCVSTSSGALNVRETASTSASIVTTLAHESVHIFTSQYLADPGYTSYARAWLLYYPNGDQGAPSGYVSARYISWKPSYGVGGCYSTTVDVAEGQYVNLRQTPSTSATSLYRLHRDDSVLVLYSPNVPVSDWTHIATVGGTGWIKTEFLSLLG